jgi:hypothetical protein
MRRSQRVMDESFLLSNIAPQVGVGFNRDIWALLEDAVRDWTRNRGTLTVITGPVFAAEDGDVEYRVVGENEVAVPTAFFKIVVDAERKEALAFEMPNEPLFGREIEEFLVSIDRLEARTGLDFLNELPDADEEGLEAAVATETWDIGDRVRTLMTRARQDVRLSMIDFEEDGDLADPAQFERLAADVRRASPTHLFLLAHGWNNTRRDAHDSYQALLAMMGAAADARPDLRPEEYRPFVIGVYWPSKAWDDGRRARSLGAAGTVPDIVDILPARTSGEVYRNDVLTLRGLLAKPDEEVTEEDRRRAWEILGRYSIEPQTPDDESVFDQPITVDEESRSARRATPRLSIADVFRVFTFWQMKKRAGAVGMIGGRQLVARLMREAPEARVHLGGHSFGSKFWLAALSGDASTLPRDVSSLALVQAAVSAHAFAERVPGTDRAGGYRAVLAHVRGPVVATYSSQDWALRFAYPAGSRLAGQTGELERSAREPDRYAALGATGAGTAGARIPLRDALAGPLRPGLTSVDGSEVIDGHSGFYNESVARLLWAAIAPN